MNKVILTGRTGKDIEVQVLQSGSKVGRLSFATSEKIKDKSGQYQVETEWHNLVVWNNQVDLFEQHIPKGTPLIITGKIHYNQWEKDGVKHYRTEILVDRVEFQQGSRNQPTEPQEPEQSQELTNNNNVDNDLPF